jgi:hypothetical protein
MGMQGVQREMHGQIGSDWLLCGVVVVGKTPRIALARRPKFPVF